MSFKNKIFLLVGVIGILGISYNAYHWFDGLTQNRIGYVFFKILKNEKVAFQYFKKSAEKGNPKGALNLGHSYYCGHGTEKDLGEARLWLLKSSLPQAQELIKEINTKDYICQTEQEKTIKQSKIEKYEDRLKDGDPEAQYFVGVCYLFGIYGKPTDYETGYKLIQSSADAGNKDGKAALGWCYFFGAGVKQDDKKAFEIFEEYAKKNIVSAESGLGMCYFLGKGVQADLQKAFEWTRRAAEGGDKKAAWNLGVMYLQGKGTNKNTDEGLRWIEVGAEYATARDQRSLGYDYEYSKETMPKNLERAFYWYKKAAEKGLCCGLYSLGLCYLQGKGVDQNIKKGIELLKDAESKKCDYAKCYLRENIYGPELLGKASAGDPAAQNKLGYCFLRGLGVEKNCKEGLQWVIKSAGQGYVQAQNNIAWLLSTSDDPEIRNGKEAVKWAQKAIQVLGETNSNALDTLAAAYAEDGDFESAVITQEKAIFNSTDKTKLKAFRAHLKAYQEKKPWRDSF